MRAVVIGGRQPEDMNPVARQRSDLLKYAMEERAAVRKLRYDGECTGEDKPRCYESCPHSYWCSELQYTLHLPF